MDSLKCQDSPASLPVMSTGCSSSPRSYLISLSCRGCQGLPCVRLLSGRLQTQGKAVSPISVASDFVECETRVLFRGRSREPRVRVWGSLSSRGSNPLTECPQPSHKSTISTPHLRDLETRGPSLLLGREHVYSGSQIRCLGQRACILGKNAKESKVWFLPQCFWKDPRGRI